MKEMIRDLERILFNEEQIRTRVKEIGLLKKEVYSDKQ